MERLVIVLYESMFVSMCGCKGLFRHNTQEILLNGFSKIMLQKKRYRGPWVQIKMQRNKREMFRVTRP